MNAMIRNQKNEITSDCQLLVVEFSTPYSYIFSIGEFFLYSLMLMVDIVVF